MNLKFVAKLVPESGLTRLVEKRICVSAEVWGMNASAWAKVVVLVFFASLAASILLLRMLLGSDALALLFAPVVASAAALSLIAVPGIVAQGRVLRMERELPSLIARLLSAYSENGNMRDALGAAANANECRCLSPEVRGAWARCCAGEEAEPAFEKLCSGIKSRYLNRAFSLIVRGLEAGTDVSRPLEMLAHDISKTAELEQEKNSKLGMMTWMISASSGFFYPLFAAFGLVIMAALESLASFTMYSPIEKGFITLVLVGYLFIGVLLDSGYNGQVKYGDFRRGVVLYFPVMALLGFGVFLAAYRALNAFVGVA